MRTRGGGITLTFVWLCLSAASARAQGPAIPVSLMFAPASIIGGLPATGTVTLNRAARLGGVEVRLYSSNPDVASVPSTLIVPRGAKTRSFLVTTRPVAAAATVRIFAYRGSGIESAALSVLPAPSRGGPAVEVGAPVPAGGQLGSPKPESTAAGPAGAALPPPVPVFIIAEPPDQDVDDSAVRRLAEDGSLYVADAAGTALLRLGAGRSEILLDPSAQDPVDGVGLARLLQVKSSPAGISVVVALRADNSRGIYRLENGRLTRLALRTDAMDLTEVTIADAGQIAYVARSAAGVLTLFQAAPGADGVPVSLDAAVGDSRVEGISRLQSNSAGDLVFLLDLSRPDGTSAQAVVRKTSAGVSVVAMTGQMVERVRGASATGRLAELRRPRIGPDGTVVLVGVGPLFDDPFVNFYVSRPGRPLAALLPTSDWNLDPASFDFEVASDGTIAIRAAPANSRTSLLYLAPPQGEALSIPAGRLQPEGRLAFGGSSRLFFLAADPQLPPDRNGRPPVGLYRLRLADGRPAGAPEEVAVYGQAVPTKPGARLLTVTERPAVSTQGVAFAASFGDPGPLAAPAAGFFQVPLDGTLASGRLVAEEGSDLPGANRLAILRDLTYRADGTLVFGGLLPGAGPLVATLTPDATISAATGTAKTQAATVAPLLASGDDLGSGRKLKAVLGPPLPLGPDRQLLAARFSQEGGPGGEGLYAIARDRQSQAVAVTGDTARGLTSAPFASFTDSTATAAAADCTTVSGLFSILGLPSVSVDGSAVFKARLDRAGVSTFGVFQWTGADVATVGLAEPAPDNMAILPGDRPPYLLDRWAAGTAGRAYLLAHPIGGKSRVYRHSAAGMPSASTLEPLVVPGATPVAGGNPVAAGGAATGPLDDLSDFVISGDGTLFVRGTDAAGVGLFRLDGAQLIPLVRQGQPVPRFADGRETPGLTFGFRFGLMPDSSRGALLFRADVGGASSGARGLFRLGPQGLETLLVEHVGVAGARDVTIEQLSDSLDHQTANGTTVFATFSQNSGWVLFRSSVARDSRGNVTSFTTTPIAQERAGLPGVPRFASLDPSLMLDLSCRTGPLFSLNDAGAVAFLASNGQRWGIYLAGG